MNKFRNNLHSAFFFPGSTEYSKAPELRDNTDNADNIPEGYHVEKDDFIVDEVPQREAAEDAVQEVDDVTSQTQDEADILHEEVVDWQGDDVATETMDLWQQIESEISDFEESQTELSFLNIEKEIYAKRWWAANISKETAKKYVWRRIENSEIWTKRIKDGYRRLLNTLQDNKYFDQPSHKNFDEIRRMYLEWVNSQYEKYVWMSSDKWFDSANKTIFWPGSEGYPVNEVYQELTWAGIFVSNKEDLRAYHIEWKKFEWEAAKTTVEERKNFLAHKLPNYLFEIKDTYKGFWSIFTRVDKITDTEKNWIENFIDLVSKLKVKEWENIVPEVALLKAFRDPEAQLNTPDYKRKEILEKYWLVVDDSLTRAVQKAWRFFLESQDSNNWVKDQRTLYLTIMSVIYDYDWMDNAIATFSSEVDTYDARAKAESWKVWEQMASWEFLQRNTDYLGFVNTLKEKWFLTDATSATRLYQRTDDYLQNAEVEDILADFNNDGEITNADRWATKTWLQFKDILNTQPDKEVAIKNLLAHAKLENSIMWLGLEDDVFEIDNIKSNRKLILLLQSIIAQPWEDFHLLLESGVDWKEKSKEYLNRLPDSEKVQAVARKLVWELNQDDIPHNPDWLMEAVAGWLYAEYAKWLWLWWEIPFDERVEWLSLNVWLQWTTEQCSLWVALSYNRPINLWKWWSVTPWASIWFVGMYNIENGEIEPWFMASVWAEVAKQWAGSNWVMRKISASWHLTWFNWVPTLSWSIWTSRDKLEWIQEWAEKKSLEFSGKIIRPMLDKLAADLWDEPFDLTKSEVAGKARELLKAEVQENISKKDFKKLKKWELDASVDSGLRFLANYNWYDLKDERVRNLISGLMAEEYAEARAYARENQIGDKFYLSWVSVWLSWVVGTQAFSVHWGFLFKKHEKDTYGDWSSQEYNLNAWTRIEEFDQAALDIINREIGADDDTKLRIVDGYTEEKYVMIPGKYLDKYVVKVSPSMKWLMKKNVEWNWNILLNPKTLIDYETLKGSWKKWATLYIGWKTWHDIDMRTIQDKEDWFIPNDQVIDAWRLPRREVLYTKDEVDRALEWIKEKRPDDDELKSYTRNSQEILDQLEQWKSYKIIINKAVDWTITHEIEEDGNWNGITVEYKAYHKQEMMSDAAKSVADEVYNQARMVKDNSLRNISHWNTAWKEYQAFAQAMSSSNYEEAKAQLEKMLINRKPTMDEYIKGTNFKGTWLLIENLTGAELWQALMSFNNVFARVSSVEWGTKDGSYKFVDWHGEWNSKREVEMDGIVEDRARWIKWRIMRSSLEEPIKQAYGNLIDAMEEHRKNNPDYFKGENGKSKASRSLDNAIWINLWNVYKVENPLFNPEIYKGYEIDINNLEFEWKDLLHRRALEIFANNQALMAPILEWLWLPIDAKVTISENQNEKWQITLDIDGKNTITLKWDLSVGYFAQCVNHMLLLSNIYAELDWWEATYSAWRSVMRWSTTETYTQDAYSTTSFRIGFAGSLGWNTAVKTDDATQWGPGLTTHPSGTEEKPGQPKTADPWDQTNSWNIR